MSTLSVAELKALLQGCLSTINQQSNLMKQCFHENNLLQALKHCSNLLNELRTNQLSPKQYYEMYIVTFDLLETLSNHLLNSHNSKEKKIQKKLESSKRVNGGADQSPFLADLYELVQYSGNIIPRLYMMIVIGTTYMSTSGAPTKNIMKDMIEMCRGVQHPIRGLFLRYYLSQRIKDLLPISNSTDFNETVEFLTSNFIEMNKLWVRLQHQGHSSERELRYRERKELKILVGSNLVRLSQIIDDYQGDKDDSYSLIKFYKEKVFPSITEQIIQCRDHLAQSYLIDVLIQIFPDDFHFAALDELLNNVFINLHPLLKKSELVTTLIERFITYHKFESDLDVKLSISEPETEKEAEKEDLDEKEDVDENEESKKPQSVNPEIEPETEPQTASSKHTITKPQPKNLSSNSGFQTNQLFSIFWNFYLKVFENDPNLSPEEHSIMLQSIIRLSLTYDPLNYQNLDEIYKFVTENLCNENLVEQELWFQLLVVPIHHFQSIKTIFKLSYFYTFYQKLNHNYQKQLSMKILDKSLQEEDLEIHEDFKYFHEIEEIDGIFKYFLILIHDSNQNLNTAKNLGVTKTIKINDGLVTQEFLDNQEKLGKFIHLVENRTDPFKNISNLMYIRKMYLNKCMENIIYTYPTLISRILIKLRLIGYYINEMKKRKKDISNQELLITTYFKNLSIIIEELYQNHQENHSELILNIFLNAASTADQLKQQSLSYELFNQCFIIYEENLILSSNQYKSHINPHDSIGGGSLAFQSILSIANKLYTLKFFNKENYESLITKLTLYGSKLLKKQDQCRAVYYCAHLWCWSDYFPDDNDDDTAQFKDSKRVLECLQKSLRVADSCMDPYLSLKLFIEILNRCLIFNIYVDDNLVIDSKYINGLIELIKTNIENLKSDDMSNIEDDNKEARLFKLSKDFFERTLDYIREEQGGEEETFEGVVV